MSIRPTKHSFSPKMILIAVVTAVGLFVWSRMTPDRPRVSKHQTAVESARAVAPVEATDLPAEKPITAPEVEESKAPQTETGVFTNTKAFAQAYAECFPEGRAGASLERHLGELGETVQRRETSMQNLHWRIGGEEKRLQVLWRAEGQELRYFDVDAEGLPVPREKPRLLTHAQAEEQKKQMESKGTRLFEQKKEVLHLRDGSVISVDWRDGKPYDVILSQSGSGLFCREERCECRSARPR